MKYNFKKIIAIVSFLGFLVLPLLSQATDTSAASTESAEETAATPEEAQPVKTPELDRSRVSRQKLYNAIMAQDQKAVESLLKSSVDPNTRDNQGGTLLMAAAITNDQALTETLINAGAQLDLTDNQGWSALMLAILAGSTETAMLLIEKGADVYLATQDGNTAMTYAFQYENQEVLDLLFSGKMDLNRVQGGNIPLLYAIRNDYQVEALKMIENGANINIANRDGVTPLMFALVRKNASIIEVLLKKEADTGAVDNRGWSVLMYAIYNGMLETAEELVRQGVDLQVESVAGETAFTLARAKGYRDLMNAIQKK